MNLFNKKVLVVGLGKTGLETAKFLLHKGAKVGVSDLSEYRNLNHEVKEVINGAERVELGKHSKDMFLWPEIIILSPGIRFNNEYVTLALSEGIDVVSEVELAWRFIKKPIIALTGSNGKTTTATLISKILEADGKRVFLGGNIGTPLIHIAEKDSDYDYIVAELSSFQLQGIKMFRPYIGIILNISQNHLNHHESFDEYIASKFKLFENQTNSDFCIYNSEDPNIPGHMNNIKAIKIPFGAEPHVNKVFSDNNNIYNGEDIYNLEGMKLIGRHNIENAMASIACASILGINAKIARDEIINFDPLPHRIEFIGDVRGGRFFNDSKSTTPHSTLRAIESLDSPIILIAGGRDKGTSFDILKNAIKKKVKLVILIGESRFRIQKEIGGEVKTEIASSLEDAITKTVKNLEAGDTVLFSPACTSFDMFNSYEERGIRFKQIVNEL
ncbi:MAG: UDP-N-acetylmuramoyl-L-alanine--D-glutamate ligase [Thermodesulfobacteriota bacterium]